MRVMTLLLAMAVAATLCATGFGAPASDETRPMPAFSTVKSAVQQHFTAIPDFEKGDLITRDQVEPLLAQLEPLGWKVADRPAILSQTLTPGDFVASELRGSKKGLAFMRAVSGLPAAYDRLDRLARLPRGKQTVHDMIHKTGGAELIKYLTTAKGGKELGKMLSHAPKGHDFNKPTGRIYTVTDLLDRLEASHKRALAPASEPSDSPESP